MNQCAAVKVYLHWKQDHNEWMNFNSTNVSMWSTKKIQKSSLQNFIELFNLWKWNFTLRHIQIFHLNGMVPPESAPGPNWIRDRCPPEFINRLTVRRQSAARTNHTISGKRAARKKYGSVIHKWRNFSCENRLFFFIFVASLISQNNLKRIIVCGRPTFCKQQCFDLGYDGNFGLWLISRTHYCTTVWRTERPRGTEIDSRVAALFPSSSALVLGAHLNSNYYCMVLFSLLVALVTTKSTC